MTNKLNIIVCIKQVPDVDDIKWTPENNLDRSLMLSKINPYDEMALNQALSLKKYNSNVNIKVVSMGPNQAADILEYALAKGADEAILLSDKYFAASDTLITSKILSRAIEKYFLPFDMVFTGQMAQDGDTQQVPASLSALLNINYLNNLVCIKKLDLNSIEVVQNADDKINIIKADFPILLAFKENIEGVELPKIDDYINAQNKKIVKLNSADLDFKRDDVGILASPTVVYKAYRVQNDKDTKTIEDNFSGNILKLINEIDK